MVKNLPQKQENNLSFAKCCQTRLEMRKRPKLMLMRPELLLQVHAKHMQEPRGEGAKPGIFGGR